MINSNYWLLPLVGFTIAEGYLAHNKIFQNDLPWVLKTPLSSLDQPEYQPPVMCLNHSPNVSAPAYIMF